MQHKTCKHKDKLGLKSKINEALVFMTKQKPTEWDKWSEKLKKIKWGEFKEEEYKQSKNEIAELMGTFQNYTARLGRQLEKIQFQLHSEEKFWRESDETKADFLSLVSHQLRTPLTISLLNIEILLAGHHGNLTRRQKKSVKEIFLSLKRMTEMLNVFSIISKIELNTFVLKPKLIDLVEILDNLLADRLADNKNAQLKAETDYDKKFSTVKADFDLINIALSNLIAYSVKNASLEKRGKVKIITCGDKLGVFICFYNNGAAIPVSEQGKVFSKRYQTDNPNREDLNDTGLGFYISKIIIDRSGGRLWFESSPEKGTSFHIFLPKENIRPTETS